MRSILFLTVMLVAGVAHASAQTWHPPPTVSAVRRNGAPVINEARPIT